jgi:hypothetical protein
MINVHGSKKCLLRGLLIIPSHQNFCSTIGIMQKKLKKTMQRQIQQQRNIVDGKILYKQNE